jgi:F420-dependent oxidoreductase-like protein
MKLGLQIGNFTWDGGDASIGPVLGDITTRADDAGFDSIWVMDHFFQIPSFGPPENAMLEGYSALAFIAARTTNAKLGTLVTGVTYRHPGILVKTVTTLDVLSGGRAYLGIGAAWNEQEHLGLGVPYPPLAERFERLEETLQIAHRMWKGDTSPFNGKHYHLAEPINSPQALTKPHPPILIGGGGEQKTLRFVAKYADACNLFTFGGDEEVLHKLDVLRRHCDEAGRPYEEIEKTSYSVFTITRDGSNGTSSPQQAIDQFAHLAEMGFDHAIFALGNQTDPEVYNIFKEEIVPAVHQIKPAGR